MWVENFYVAGQEYVITFKDGIHHVFEVYPDDAPSHELFTGHYDECVDYKNELLCGYESF
jgi:hypothetical protein